MTVLKRKRKASQFEVFHHLYEMRRDLTNLLLVDFGLSPAKEQRVLQKVLNKCDFDQLSDKDKERVIRTQQRIEGFHDWFISSERSAIVDYLREITRDVFEANSIYPTCMAEYEQRRLMQDQALGKCYGLAQELQYVIEALPVSANKYTRFAESIQTEINLIKGWRQSDNRLKRALSTSASSFANANGNGNANHNGASNVNGIRPDFDTTNKGTSSRK